MANLDQHRRLTHAERRQLMEKIKLTLLDLEALSADETFQFHEVTGYLERLLQDWYEVAGPDVLSASSPEQAIPDRLLKIVT